MAEEEKEKEFAEAAFVQVHETNVLHASDVVYWLNAASAENEEDMQQVNVDLVLQLENKPRDAKLVNSRGKTAILRKPQLDIVEGYASEAQRTRPAQTTYSFTGEVYDKQGRFNPARFNLTLGAGNGETVVIYPTPLGTARQSGGTVFGSILLDSNQAPIIWGLLELEVTLPGPATQIYRAQTDSKGDFVIALNRLPPLPDAVTNYSAVLRLNGNLTNDIANAPDLNTYTDFELESITSSSTFNLELSLAVIPGMNSRINSNGKEYLAAQAS